MQIFEGTLTENSSMIANVAWPGGFGMLVVSDATFTGAGEIQISAVSDEFPSTNYELIPGLASLTANGTYRFSGPKGWIAFQVPLLGPGDSATFGLKLIRI